RGRMAASPQVPKGRLKTRSTSGSPAALPAVPGGHQFEIAPDAIRGVGRIEKQIRPLRGPTSCGELPRISSGAIRSEARWASRGRQGSYRRPEFHASLTRRLDVGTRSVD